jgi:hypothetical protein
MDVLQIQGDAFSGYFLHKILPHEAKLVSRLDESGAERAWRGLNGLLTTSSPRTSRQPSGPRHPSRSA